MRLKNIEDVEFCPHCGSDLGYYQKVFAKGWIQDNTLFEIDRNTNERPKYNYGMYDSLKWSKEKPTCYCMECDKPIGIIKKEK
ncbi:hypothetical protein [Elizabethkingia anophelis]|uniref:Uncharacterized protein n=2 Tax=Elizabethkingia anophelis TaxID=1117645 RepID=A0A455ZFM5_9FLAO|nr:hypothetical protein [Elizabethkingia anophelis]ATC35584.1 hypothetical protein BAZ09_004870 [Elizabethkingia anophelis R26]ATC39222.1 hypothetical protein EAAG1_004870 [Elizabethkingia anophelis Ag1]ATC42903.1 hypothetical protein CMV41_04870 [Elizabethkingia anophelis]ATC46579.1 hypothetical protein CMV40_04870 [Elizabethkingia anophelis]ELR81185.1 hypothetical protein D505_00505 [Elizabethkingia anophelis R26]